MTSLDWIVIAIFFLIHFNIQIQYKIQTNNSLFSVEIGPYLYLIMSILALYFYQNML